ncbi:uncharacterized protein LOC111355441 [Spodoptera litura]|uniref:Uncharacterized protein LOC111355441 n=1 Tax=Spodoptera litura TaxID=69820 RepID=A0A9J7EAD6_SPOLT|nr:uncharacterized protein LOC111355441 [Spodoptera litura]
MSDSSAFTSLYDLVNDHLSKCSLKMTSEDHSSSMFKLPQFLNDTRKEVEQKEVEKCKEMEEDDYVIDLMKAVEVPKSTIIRDFNNNEVFIETDLNNNYISNPIDIEPQKEQLLPIKTDISYILKQKVKKGKCSPFGKVLISRQKPVAAPYLKEKVETNIVSFDFSTKSPCDLILEHSQWKPGHTV